MESKYDQIELKILIKAIQNAMVEINTPELKRKMSSAKFSKKAKDIRDMMKSATARLRKMNRSDPQYFFVGALVIYQPLPLVNTDPFDDWGPPAQPIRDAVVKGFDQVHSYILVEGERQMFKVDPNTLKLKHLRWSH